MPRRRGRDIYARTLRDGEKSSARFVDLAVEFVDERDLSLVFAVGGRWDRRLKRWSNEAPRSALQVKLHPGQLEAARFFADWFEAYLTGNPLDPEIYSTLLIGGSRAGKTDLGKKLTVAFLACVPGARVWLVQPTKTEDDDELENEFDELIPEAWAVKSGRSYKFANGAKATTRSAKYPHALKKGRCDWAFLNEGQNVKQLAFAMLRMRTSDTGGMVIVAANPPNNNPDRQWVADWKEQDAKGIREHARCFHFVMHDNPHVRQEQLAQLAQEMDRRSYRIEVEGEILQPSNAVYHAFSPIENVDAMPDFGDVTAGLAERAGFGRGISDLVGMDFQRSPHMAASVARAFENPLDPDRPLLYYRACLLVEQGDEYDLSDALYGLGLRPETTALVGDASGEWQDADRTKGGSSFDCLVECGWRRPKVPDRYQRRNPDIAERMKNDNRLFESKSGQRLVLIDPEAADLIAAIKQWRNGPNGQPMRASQWAHACDSMSYLNWRVYPRKTWQSEIGYKTLRKRQRRKQLRRI